MSWRPTNDICITHPQVCRWPIYLYTSKYIFSFCSRFVFNAVCGPSAGWCLSRDRRCQGGDWSTTAGDTVESSPLHVLCQGYTSTLRCSDVYRRQYEVRHKGGNPPPQKALRSQFSCRQLLKQLARSSNANSVHVIKPRWVKALNIPHSNRKNPGTRHEMLSGTLVCQPDAQTPREIDKGKTWIPNSVGGFLLRYF